MVASFALTTLDSATRLLRFNVSEIGASLRIDILPNRYLATAVAVCAICFFAFYQVPDDTSGVLKPAGLVLWTPFGTTNQLLAGLTLLVATLYLHQRGRNPWFTGLPMVFMLVSTFTALVENLAGFFKKDQYLLLIVGTALLLVGAGIVVDGIRAFLRRERHSDDMITLSAER